MPITIPLPELWDASTSSFIPIQNEGLIIEHSLLSVHEWEKRWKKPFLSEREKTLEELNDYIKCMTLNDVPDVVYKNLPYSVYVKVKEYIEDPMSATTFNDAAQTSGRREVITAELIYYNMVAFNIPFECAKWHLNTLIALIKVCSIKNGGDKKMSRADNGIYQRQLNEQRLAAQRAKNKAKR